MPGDWFSMQLKAIPCKALVGSPCFEGHGDAGIVAIGNNKLDSGKSQLPEAKISQRKRGCGCSAGTLTGLPDPVAEIAKIV